MSVPEKSRSLSRPQQSRWLVERQMGNLARRRCDRGTGSPEPQPDRARNDVNERCGHDSTDVGKKISNIDGSSRRKTLGPFIECGVGDCNNQHNGNLSVHTSSRRYGPVKQCGESEKCDEMLYFVVDLNTQARRRWHVCPGKQHDPVKNQHNRRQANSEDRDSGKLWHFRLGCSAEAVVWPVLGKAKIA